MYAPQLLLLNDGSPSHNQLGVPITIVSDKGSEIGRMKDIQKALR